MCQSHRFLAENMGYYGNWYSTCHNIISRFLFACYNVNPQTSKENVTVLADLLCASRGQLNKLRSCNCMSQKYTL